MAEHPFPFRDLRRGAQQRVDSLGDQLEGFQAPGLILPSNKQATVRRVRNQGTGRVLPCCWDDCQADGDDFYRVMVPHDAPRWPGEKLIYIFCSYAHRDMYVAQVMANRPGARIK